MVTHNPSKVPQEPTIPARRQALVHAAGLGLGSLLCLPALASPAIRQPALLVYGDSLSAAYGLKVEEGWPSLLAHRLRDGRYPHRLVNRSLSGETTHGGLQRLPRVLQADPPAVTILALGANDGLRGLSLQATEANLARMIEQLQKAGSRVLLVGIQLPPNFGPAVSKAFANLYPALARRYSTGLVPFMLERFAFDESYFQPDRIHPTAAAQPLILNTLWPQLRPLLTARR